MKEKYFEQYDKLVEPLCSMCKERFDEKYYDQSLTIDVIGDCIEYGWEWSDEEWWFWNQIHENIDKFIEK